MSATRTLYAAQTGTIGGTAFAVQSASCETSIPIEDLTVFGRLGSAGRFQKDVATCKADVKVYAFAGMGKMVSGLIVDATAGTTTIIKVAPNGFTMSGILSSFSVDSAKGDFVTASFSFAGVGEAKHDSAANPGVAKTQFASVTPYLSSDVTVSDTCPSSMKFSLDIPNEVVSCLGGAITGGQVFVSTDNIMFSKPPFKSSLTIEGLAVNVAGGISTLKIGNDVDGASPPVKVGTDCVSIDIVDGETISKSFNQSAGDLGATFSYNVEGTDLAITNS